MNKKHKRYTDEHRPSISYMDPRLNDINYSVMTNLPKMPSPLGQKHRGASGVDDMSLSPIRKGS